MVDETLESAALRSFVVSIRSRPGMNPRAQQVVVVKAFSIIGAKRQAVKKLAQGKFKNRDNINMWVFDSVEPVEPRVENGSGESNG